MRWDSFDFVIDSVGLKVLASCRGVVKPEGILLSFDAFNGRISLCCPSTIH